MGEHADLVPLAYLVSRYPAVSHTFILREIQSLRALGHRIHTASINPPDRAREAMDAVERAEADATYVVKAHGVPGALTALAWWGWRSPRALLQTLRQGVRLGGWRKGLPYALEAAMVGRWMAQHGLRHLHVHFGNAGATVGMLVKLLSACHLSYTIHGPDEFDDVSGQHLSAKMDCADAVVCISQFARGQLMRISDHRNWPKLQVCRLGVDPGLFAYQPRQPHVGPVRLLCVGRLTPAKGQLLLVQACHALAQQQVDCTLTLVGEGPDRPRIEAEVARLGLASRIVLRGALGQQAVREELATADIFVLPSLAEGIPVVLMEAMASGVVCLSTPVNGIPELIESGHSGLLAMAGDVDSLVARLQALCQDAGLRLRLAEAGRKTVETSYDLGRNTRQLGEIFASFPAMPRGTD